MKTRKEINNARQQGQLGRTRFQNRWTHRSNDNVSSPWFGFKRRPSSGLFSYGKDTEREISEGKIEQSVRDKVYEWHGNIGKDKREGLL